MAKEFGAFNIKTGQFLGKDDEAWLLRDDLRTLVLWGEMDLETGRFVATRNPVKFIEGEDGGTGIRFNTDGKISGISTDNSVDYRGSEFFDEAFMQRGTTGHIQVKDVAAYAAHLSAEAKGVMVTEGKLAETAHTSFFKMPE